LRAPQALFRQTLEGFVLSSPPADEADDASIRTTASLLSLSGRSNRIRKKITGVVDNDELDKWIHLIECTVYLAIIDSLWHGDIWPDSDTSSQEGVPPSHAQSARSTFLGIRGYLVNNNGPFLCKSSFQCGVKVPSLIIFSLY
jgi:hypothetical protein